MTRYFRYQLETLPEKPLGHWTFWARYRVCDNLQAVYWLYNLTGDGFLLELGDLSTARGMISPVCSFARTTSNASAPSTA